MFTVRQIYLVNFKILFSLFNKDIYIYIFIYLMTINKEKNNVV